jgi:hypothetical protein
MLIVDGLAGSLIALLAGGGSGVYHQYSHVQCPWLLLNKDFSYNL